MGKAFVWCVKFGMLEMISGRRVIAIIPARGGSKSIPYKNLANLGGKPLIAWPIDVAKKTSGIDRIIVSTDDDKIASAAINLGAEVYKRPANFATDTALVIDTLRDLYQRLLNEGEASDIFVLLEATSPFRCEELIMRCLARIVEENLDSIATFHDADVNPERTWKINNGHPVPFIEGAIAWKPRQQLTPAYQLNGAVYAFKPADLPMDSPSILFGRMGAEIVPADSVIDIDDPKDLKVANALLQS